HRLRAAGLPLGLIVFFFVPIVNLLLFAVLAVLPSRTAEVVSASAPRRPGGLALAHRRLVRDSHWRSGAIALAITVPLTVLGIVLGANVLESYGFSLFVGLPFALGMFSVLLFGFSRPQSFGACMVVAAVATFFSGLGLVVFA